MNTTLRNILWAVAAVFAGSSGEVAARISMSSTQINPMTSIYTRPENFKTFQIDNGLYISVDTTVMQAGIAKAPDAEHAYKGRYVIPDYVDYRDYEGTVHKVPVTTLLDGFSESEVEEIVLNNVITQLNYRCLIGCKNLKKVVVPAESAIFLSGYALGACQADIEWGQGVYISLDGPAGWKCNKLDLTGKNVFIENTAFDMGRVPNLIFPGDVEMRPAFLGMHNKTISTISFKGEKISDRNKEKLFDKYVFGYLEGLVQLSCEWPVPPPLDEEVDIDYYTRTQSDFFERCVLVVPDHLVETYRNAPVWKRFKTIKGATGGVSDILSDRALVSKRYFDLQGREIKNPSAGSIVIELSRYSDGSVESTRQYIK